MPDNLITALLDGKPRSFKSGYTLYDPDEEKDVDVANVEVQIKFFKEHRTWRDSQGLFRDLGAKEDPSGFSIPYYFEHIRGDNFVRIIDPLMMRL